MTFNMLIHEVGHGQAIHAFTPNGQTIVIDLGCTEEFSPLQWLKKSRATIDLLIITHPHGDHIDEILKLGSLGFQVRQLWRPKWLSEEDVRKANQDSYSERLNCYFDDFNNTYTHTLLEREAVRNPNVNGGVKITSHSSQSCGTSNINNHSGVTVFEYQGVKIVVPGDNEPPSWRALIAKDSFVKSVKGAHILIPSHHGRESGYCEDLFSSGIIEPRLCIVSDGRVQDTDAVSRYSGHSLGWKVQSRSDGTSNERKCLTTRNDGYIDVRVGLNDNSKSYLSVERK